MTAELRIPFAPPSHAAHVAWNPIADSAFAPQGAFAVTTNYGEMCLYQATGERVNSFGLGGNPSHAVAFSPEGSFLVAAGADGVARTYGTWTGGEEAFALPSGGVPLRDAAFNPAKRLDFELATVGVDGKVRVWRDLFGSELPARNFEYIGPSLAATPNGGRYAVVGRAFWYGRPEEWAPVIEVIDASSGETILTRPSLESPFSGRPTISADGEMVAFAAPPDGNIVIIDVDTGGETIVPDSAGFPALSFGAGGAVLASAGYDGSITIWDTDSGQLLQRLEGHGDRHPANSSKPQFASWVAQLAFRPLGTDLASVGYDGTVRVWDLAGRQRTRSAELRS